MIKSMPSQTAFCRNCDTALLLKSSTDSNQIRHSGRGAWDPQNIQKIASENFL